MLSLERSVLPLVCILKVVIFPDEAHLFILYQFRQLISQLKLIYITLDGEVRIAYDDSDDYVHIICKSYGHIKVDAQLGGSWRDNWVKLVLNTDQTVLNEVIQQCNSILKN